MIRSPRLLTSLGAGEALRQVVQVLEHQLHRDMMLIFGKDLLAEILLKRLADHKDQLTESAANRVEDRVIHDGLAIRSQTIQLFQATIAAAHSGRQYK